MTISDERLAEMVGAGVPCVPAQPGEIAAVVQELRALRSKPVAGVEVKPVEIEDLIEQLLDAQQDINLAANENMDQSLCDASALIDKTEAMLHRILATLSLPAQEPDHVYDPNDWEYTLPWEDREQLIEEWQPNEVHKVATLVDGPDKWIVWLETNGDYDVHWFDSEAEANSALTAALKGA